MRDQPTILERQAGVSQPAPKLRREASSGKALCVYSDKLQLLGANPITEYIANSSTLKLDL